MTLAISQEIYDPVGELILPNVGKDVACNVSTDRIRVSRINQQSHLFIGGLQNNYHYHKIRTNEPR